MTVPSKAANLPSPFLQDLLAGCLTGKDSIRKQLTARPVSVASQGDMPELPSYELHDAKGRGTRNACNETSGKTLKVEQCPIDIEVPRDRDGSFEDELIKKRLTRLPVSTTMPVDVRPRDNRAGSYRGTSMTCMVWTSPDVIWPVMSAVAEDALAWQSPAARRVYPIVDLDTLAVEVRDQGVVRDKFGYIASSPCQASRRSRYGPLNRR